ncbi:hypothetical protein ACJIZ3_019152 [Penstemon smallii]|uniref:Uncharacterized protein n=1 Tax=Penstemon smallii TaxID=265156 RepID=A0ABD3T1A3_9LAMI
MSAVSNFSCRHYAIRPAFRSDNRLCLKLSFRYGGPLKFNITKPFREVDLSLSRKASMRSSIRMTFVDEKLTDRSVIVKPADILAYELVQGADVRWSYILDKSTPEPPTAVLLHGILGSRKNWGGYYSFIRSQIYLKANKY